MFEEYQWYDVVGNFGVLCVLSAFGLLQYRKIDAKNAVYSLLNGVGAVLILISLLFAFNVSAFILQVFWRFFSAYGLWKSLLRR